jgi:hypothetical protein
VTQPIIIAASGKALLLVPDHDTGQKIITAVTRKTLLEAPGLEIHGAISEGFAFDTAPLYSSVAEVHRRHEELRGCVPSQQLRFLRLPIVTECATSGLPAAEYDKHSPETRKERSAVSLAKRRAAEAGWSRLRSIALPIELARSVEDLERLEEVDWLAVIHADGNGLGQLFLDFHNHLEQPDNRLYADTLRDFSKALDDCTKAAFRYALQQIAPLWHRQRSREGRVIFLPLVPLVLGGDDLTVICSGRLAVPFTVAFLQEFERQTARGIVGKVAAGPSRSGPGRLSACAGVAIIKPHFPFYAAYALAEDLLKRAKMVKRKLPGLPCSAFDFHVLYDASGPELNRIRGQLTVDGKNTVLVARPYVVTPLADLPAANPSIQAWVKQRHVERLRGCLKAVQAEDENGRRCLPSSMLHELRESLFQGRVTAEAQLELALGRHFLTSFGNLLVNDRLFWPEMELNEQDAPVQRYYTALLDAMELNEFWE